MGGSRYYEVLFQRSPICHKSQHDFWRRARYLPATSYKRLLTGVRPCSAAGLFWCDEHRDAPLSCVRQIALPLGQVLLTFFNLFLSLLYHYALLLSPFGWQTCTTRSGRGNTPNNSSFNNSGPILIQGFKVSQLLLVCMSQVQEISRAGKVGTA